MGIIKDSIYKIANKQFLPLFKSQTIFPYYHIVRNDKVSHIEHLYAYKNEAQFRADIDFLLQHYTPINDLDAVRKGVPNSFLLSFDDGLEEVYSVVFPILKEKNLKAVFFLNPDFIDNHHSLYKHDISVIITHLKALDFDLDKLNVIAALLNFEFKDKADFLFKIKNISFKDKHLIVPVLDYLTIDIKNYLSTQKPYLSKAQVQEMIDYGMFFGGHTMSHPPLHQLSHEEKKAEITNSIDWVKREFHLSYAVFAFPFSDKNISRKLLNELFEYDPAILLFGNSGLKKDIDARIVQRFSLENPFKKIHKVIVTENLYKIFNKMIGKYQIKR